MACRRAVRAAFVVAIVVVVGSLAWAGKIKTEVYSPRTLTAYVNGRLQVVRDICVSGQVLIRLAPSVTAEQFGQMLRRHKATVLRAFPRYGIFLVSLPEGESVRNGVARWSAEPGVAVAEPNRLCFLTLTPNDPLYDQQWHWPKINAPAGWDMTTGSENVVVAIIDSGADADHEDLAGRFWVNADEIPANGVDDDNNGYVDDINGWDFIDDDNTPWPQPTDVNTQYENASHGTHVAGLVGAATNNGKGVAGHDWECRLMILRVFDEDGGGATVDRIIAAIDYAISNGADVINCSFGSAYTNLEDAVIQNARQQGIVVVAAAGNDNVEFTDDPNTWISPICNDGPNPQQDNWVLGVAATDQNDKKADFSNYDGSSVGTFVDVSAPGVDILSCVYHDPTNGFDKAYDLFQGTSMATPIVSGLVALIKAAWPNLGPVDIINQIKQTCVDINALNPGYEGKLGAGRIDSAAAIGLDMPPGPPRNVIAADTPNDEGGSITVTWSKSVDDGGGANDVIEYIVYRCDNAKDENGNDVPEGNWTKLATIPVGEPTYYVDTPVPNHTPFWYKVSCRDRSNESESKPAGPAEARDDLPPPPVENLVAADTQADDGGSISLSWSAYSPPPDFEGFRVYRATRDFTKISQADMIADLPGDPNRKFYRDATTTDGVEYWYAVTAYDDEGNEVQQVKAVGPVASSPNMMVSLPAGLSMIAIGAETRETDMAALLGIAPEELRLARWDPAQEAYRTYQANPADELLRQKPGRGFWVVLPEPLMLNISGQPVRTETFTIALTAGWNQLGNPFAHDLRWQGVMVSARGTQFTLAESNNAGITRDFAWTWDPYARSYRLVSEYEGFGDKTIRQGYGFWFLAFENCDLILPGQVEAAAAGKPRTVKVNWKLRLVARCGELADRDNFIGVSPQASKLNRIVSPPVPSGGVDLYFVNKAVAGRAAASFVQPGKPARWQVKVACAGLAGREIEVTWPDLSALPWDVRPVLIDRAAGRRVYMRTTTRYSFRPAPGEVERPLEIVAAGGAGPMQLEALAARPTAAGVDVCFTLSAPAAVTIDVLNLAGRRVARIIAGRQMAAGPCSVRWNATNSAGSPVPAGRYLVRVVARGADGQQVTASTAVVVRR